MNISQEVLVIRIQGHTAREQPDLLAVEQIVSLRVNGEEIVSLLCSPSELEALATGFLLSEGLIASHSDLVSVQLDPTGAIVDAAVGSLPAGWRERFRTKTLTSGCGQGITFGASHLSAQQTSRNANPPVRVTPAAIGLLLERFRTRSSLFLATGGAHSAALADGHDLLLFSEDIGRHNAVDKIIGRALLGGVSLHDKLLLSSGRVSSEIMGKVARAGIPILVSRAAPTCMSVAAAEAHGVTLIGFARGQRMNVYTHPGRLDFDGMSFTGEETGGPTPSAPPSPG